MPGLTNRWHCNSLFCLCRELSVVLNVNLPDMLLERERREERMDGIEGMYTRRKGWGETKKRMVGFKRRGWGEEGEVKGKDERQHGGSGRHWAREETGFSKKTKQKDDHNTEKVKEKNAQMKAGIKRKLLRGDTIWMEKSHKSDRTQKREGNRRKRC